MSAELGWITTHPGLTESVIAIHGEIDLSNGDRLQREADKAADEGENHGVAIDLTEIEYIDSRGLLLLFHLARRLRDKRVPFSLIAPPDSIAGRLLELVQIEELAPVRPSRTVPHPNQR
jgi:anti-anti-sigma factor